MRHFLLAGMTKDSAEGCICIYHLLKPNLEYKLFQIDGVLLNLIWVQIYAYKPRYTSLWTTILCTNAKKHLYGHKKSIGHADACCYKRHSRYLLGLPLWVIPRCNKSYPMCGG